jgi:hypothetical protein
MKRRMESFKPETRKAVDAGKPAKSEGGMRVKDPGMLAAPKKAKKQEPDVYPTRKVPAKGRPKGGGGAMTEKLMNKRI